MLFDKLFGKKKDSEPEKQEHNPAPAPEAPPMSSAMMNLLGACAPGAVELDTTNLDWIYEQIPLIQNLNLEESTLHQLGRELILASPESYSRHFEEYMTLIGSLAPVRTACESLLAEGKAVQAHNAAAPCLKYLLAHPELYARNQVYFRSPAERTLYQLDNRPADRPEVKEDYPGFFLLCSRMSGFSGKKETLLRSALKLSPCSSEIWQALAAIYHSHPTKYHYYSTQALYYALEETELGAVYADMADFYAPSDPVLSGALGALSKKFGTKTSKAGEISHAADVSSVMNAEAVVSAARIPTALSQGARKALEAHA